MSRRIENLRDLFVEQGRELYSAVKLEQKELPKIQTFVKSLVLRSIIDEHLGIIGNETAGLERAFKNLYESPDGVDSLYCEAVLKQTRHLIGRCKDPDVFDAAVLNSIQHLNHHMITGLGSLISYAKEIGYQDIAGTLHDVLDEEKLIDRELSRIGENDINKKAVNTFAFA